ncbi:zinc-dependent alcohol dehydrogenase family protein [Bifidobacterium callimiconis]|uniref:Alcohol dehydrogenase n=1 Tax=Bifidobacterium callimiconis TaxID=2306973 RepID=A0A430FIF7_9BIFI|nr:zinc-dependent alcohol dehydrogenase family protein [Bifidobacterium callimiconis]RSX52626.1 alcohol dehydrogenase [Bifidobacterium callimiconis]
MKAAVFIEPGRMEVHEVPEPRIEKPDDAIVRVIKACVCGSDLWWFRGISQRQHGSLTGHEAIGIIDRIGEDVRTLKPGDLVIVPFTHGCGRCAACRAGFEANCTNAEPGGNAGYQAEAMRAPKADTALVKVPGDPKSYSDAVLNSLLTLADVMATGYHAAVSAEVKPGDTAVVFGDGAVGLSGVLSARMLGASRIIAMSRHEDRAAIARESGATDIVPERGNAAVNRVLELTGGSGADAVLECVGSAQSIETAVRVGRPGSTVGRVGVPHDAHIDVDALFWRNIGLKGGPASVATYDRDVLLPAVLSGMIDPGRMFTGAFDLDRVQDAYEAMSERRVVKSLINIGEI